MAYSHHRWLVLGGSGTLGSACHTILVQSNLEVLAPTREQLDLTNASALRELFDLWRPTHVINSAAYTSVDAAQVDHLTCNVVNINAVSHLISLCGEYESLLSHVSTASVFNGRAGSIHQPSSTRSPLNWYNHSKAVGEALCEQAIEAGAFIQFPRIYWLYNSVSEGFVSQVIDRAHRDKAVRVVEEQYGQPTYAPMAAREIITLLRDSEAMGPLHVTPSGTTSRVFWTRKILDLCGMESTPVIPVQATFFPDAAPRPEDVTLSWADEDRGGLRSRDWEDTIAQALSAK